VPYYNILKKGGIKMTEYEKLALEYLETKEREKEITQRLTELQQKLHSYFQESGQNSIPTPRGVVVRQARTSVSWNEAMIRRCLPPEYWERISKLDPTALKQEIQRGSISEEDIAPAKEEKVIYAIVVMPPNGKSFPKESSGEI